MTLWFAMAALTLLAALWLTRPLWQRRPRQGIGRDTANVVAYSSRLTELQADIAAGVLPVDEAAAIQQEMDARLLADAQHTAAPLPPQSRQPRLAVLLVTLAFAGMAAFWYWQAGSWRMAELIATAPAPTGVPGDAEIAGMVAKLAARLETQPDDADGWSMLGRSYFVMGRHADAAKAYEKANGLSKGSKAEWLVNEGEALALSRERDLLGRPAQLFEAALVLEPGYGKALWYGSLADAQASHFERAGERLQMLLAQDLPDDLKTMVLARLDELRALAGSPALAAAPSTPAAQAASTAAGGTTLTVQITLADALADALAKQLPANATLFVFAKAAQGPPMPLAVQKLPGATLPLTITLDDSMGMTPAMRLSQFERYVVTARYSASGSAPAATGDLEGSAEAVRGASAPVVVEINRVVP